MNEEVALMQGKIIELLRSHLGTLKITMDTLDKFEVSGTIEAMQGKKKVDGIYFASVIPKPKDVRFYFFPTYTHKEKIGELPAQLQKCLKGKSCFHIKKLDDSLESDIKDLIQTGIELYQKDGWLK